VKHKTDGWTTPVDSCLTADIKEAEDAAGEIIFICKIDMEKMKTEFNLEYNDVISARVRAVNAAGLNGEYRESDDSAHVK